MESAVRGQSKETAALWQVNAALREAELGNSTPAKQGVTSASALSTGRDVEVIAAFTLARAGDDTEANTMAVELEKNYPTETLMKLYWLPAVNAAIQLDEGNASQALSDLEAVRPYELGGAGTTINYVYPAYLRGEACLLAHNANAAAAEFQKLLDHGGIVLNVVTGRWFISNLPAPTLWPVILPRREWPIRDLFALWEDADSEIPLLSQARTEYVNLR